MSNSAYKLTQRLLFVLVLVGISLFFKISNSSEYSLVVTSTLFDAGIYILMCWLFYALPRKIIAEILFYIFLTLHTIIVFSYSYFLDEYVLKGYSLLALSYGRIASIGIELFPMTKFVILVAVLAGLAWALGKVNKTLPKYLIRGFAIVSIILVAIVPLHPAFTHPYANTVRDVLQSGNQIKVVETDVDYTKFINTLNGYDAGELKYKKIYLFVMEETSESAFTAAVTGIPDNNDYFYLTRDHTFVYDNYFTSAQDSRTSIMSMLSSIFIPYESYSYKDWEKRYAEKALKQPNLVDFFNHNGYKTTFLVSSVIPTAGIKDYKWSEIMNIDDAEFERSEYVCLHIFQYQKGCEDKILSDDLKLIAKSDTPSFVMLEFVYGHGSDYMKRLNMSRTEYYNAFLLDFYNYLKEEDLLEDSLIIVTADHGLKGRANESTIYNSKIPLLVYAPDITNGRSNALYSQLDFNDLVLSHAADGYKPKAGNEYVYVVGSTGSNLVSYYGADDNFAMMYDYNPPQLLKTDEVFLERISKRFSEFLKYREDFPKQD